MNFASFSDFIAMGNHGLYVWSAYGISGFEALSSPGVVPMATTFVMIYSSGTILWEVLRKKPDPNETLAGNIIPMPIIVTIVMVALYAVALQPLGFIPTSILFLLVMVRYLSGRGWGFCLGVSVGTVMRTIWPFYGALIFALALVTFVPAFTTWLPGLFMSIK